MVMREETVLASKYPSINKFYIVKDENGLFLEKNLLAFNLQTFNLQNMIMVIME